jgi:hypothetical protein
MAERTECLADCQAPERSQRPRLPSGHVLVGGEGQAARRLPKVTKITEILVVRSSENPQCVFEDQSSESTIYRLFSKVGTKPIGRGSSATIVHSPTREGS